MSRFGYNPTTSLLDEMFSPRKPRQTIDAAGLVREICERHDHEGMQPLRAIPAVEQANTMVEFTG